MTTARLPPNFYEPALTPQQKHTGWSQTYQPAPHTYVSLVPTITSLTPSSLAGNCQKNPTSQYTPQQEQSETIRSKSRASAMRKQKLANVARQNSENLASNSYPLQEHTFSSMFVPHVPPGTAPPLPGFSICPTAFTSQKWDHQNDDSEQTIHEASSTGTTDHQHYQKASVTSTTSGFSPYVAGTTVTRLTARFPSSSSTTNHSRQRPKGVPTATILPTATPSADPLFSPLAAAPWANSVAGSSSPRFGQNFAHAGELAPPAQPPIKRRTERDRPPEEHPTRGLLAYQFGATISAHWKSAPQKKRRLAVCPSLYEWLFSRS